MKYNLLHQHEVKEAKNYLNTLIDKECLVEIKKISPKRSLNQNSYLHLIITAFGEHFGYTLEEAKQIYKNINKDVYQYQRINKKGKLMTFMRSSADLDKDEMAKTIDKLIRTSAENGCELPPATDQDWLRAISNRAEGSYYL